ncbi:hypothetical protein K7G98_06875 [Saccharothrix sp. MB29]|nr:hypothetical protein [Saccharothrix sp. MB29]
MNRTVDDHPSRLREIGRPLFISEPEKPQPAVAPTPGHRRPSRTCWSWTGGLPVTGGTCHTGARTAALLECARAPTRRWRRLLEIAKLTATLLDAAEPPHVL